jgi:tRNA threonylcarbamoyladenosine biosynthesis protein TsaB
VSPPDRPILAIETTQRTGGVAIALPEGRVLAEHFEPARRHDDRLMPAIDELCRRAGVGPRDLGGVAVSRGPGGFSGLRIGLTTAKMLARSLAIPVLGVPSALVVAEGTPDAAGLEPEHRLLVVLAAKRDHGWLSHLERNETGDWRIAADHPPATGDAGAVDWTRLGLVLGDEHLPETFREAAARAAVPVRSPRFDPVACLRLAMRGFAAGEHEDPVALAPIYPGPPEAVVRWDALHGPA